MKFIKKVLFIMILMFITCSLFACSMIGDIIDSATGNDEDGESLEVTQEQAEEKLERIATEKGYLVTYAIYETENSDIESETMVIGASGDYTWYIDGDQGGAFMYKDGMMYTWKYEDGSWEYNGRYETTEEESASLTNLFSSYLLLGYSFGSSMKKAGTKTIAGRKCDIYTYKIGMLGYSYGYSYYLDQETGMCMKYEIDAKAAGESASVGMEVTQIKFDVDPIELPPAIEAVDFVPANFKLETEYNRFIKIGDDLYLNTNLEYGDEKYYKKTENGYKAFYRYDYAENWESEGEISFYTLDYLLENMLGSIYYEFKTTQKCTKVGTKQIAGVTCDKLKYVQDEGTDYEWSMYYYQDPTTKFVFAVAYDEDEYLNNEVKSFTTSISSFGVDLPE